VAIAPVLKKALRKGHQRRRLRRQLQPDARQWFVNQAEFNGIAKAMIDSLAARRWARKAAFAIVTSTFTTPNQARWIAEMAAYAAEVPPEDEVAGNGGSAGRQHPQLQPGQHAHQQVRR
jgi:rhamnose transport system substrate-binding protein